MKPLFRPSFILLLCAFVGHSSLAKNEDTSPPRPMMLGAASNCMTLWKRLSWHHVALGNAALFAALSIGVAAWSIKVQTTDIEQQLFLEDLHGDDTDFSKFYSSTVGDELETQDQDTRELIIWKLKHDKYFSDTNKGKWILNDLILRLDRSSDKTTFLRGIQSLSRFRTETSLGHILSKLEIAGSLSPDSDPEQEKHALDLLQTAASLANAPFEVVHVGRKARELLLKDYDLSHLGRQARHPFAARPELKDKFFSGIYLDWQDDEYPKEAYDKNPGLYKALFDQLSDKSVAPSPHSLEATK